MTSAADRQDRREFFRSFGRNAAFVVLGIVGVLGARRDGEPKAETCPSRGRCQGCRLLQRCGLPRGISARRVLNGN